MCCAVFLPLGLDNNDIVIKPNESGDVPTIDKDGNITMPENGKVQLPNVGTVVVPEGSVVKPNGEIVAPNGGTTIEKDGTVIVPGSNGENITVHPVQNANGTVTVPSVDKQGNVETPGNTQITLPEHVQVGLSWCQVLILCNAITLLANNP